MPWMGIISELVAIYWRTVRCTTVTYQTLSLPICKEWPDGAMFWPTLPRLVCLAEWHWQTLYCTFTGAVIGKVAHYRMIQCRTVVVARWHSLHSNQIPVELGVARSDTLNAPVACLYDKLICMVQIGSTACYMLFCAN